jgi:hypothetical protein
MLRCDATSGTGLSESKLRDLIDSRLDARLKKTEEKLDQIINELKKKEEEGGKASFSATKVSPTAERNRVQFHHILATMNTRQVGWSQQTTSTRVNRKPASRAAQVRRLIAEIEAKQAGWKRPTPLSVATTEK